MLFALATLLWATACLASVLLWDPSDAIPPALWPDNAIIPNYNIPFVAMQPSPILSPHTYNTSAAVDHKFYTVSANDSSAILVSDGAQLNASYINVLKYGYSSNLLTASFYGFNAAVNVANGSIANIDHANITVHDGAANVYAYGNSTLVQISDSWLYSSGPVSHGLYASGYATIIGRRLRHFSGGRRSSSFAGDSPAGHIYVYDSVGHTQGIGSAGFYALGSIYAENVATLSEQAPVVFMDGAQSATLVGCDCTAGLLGGVALFSSMVRQSGARLSLTDTRITVLGATTPGLWFGNTIAQVTIEASAIATESGVLLAANTSQITQDFDHYAGYDENPGLLPAEVYATVVESTLVGDLVAYNGSYVSWRLGAHSTWTGALVAGFGRGHFDVSLDNSSTWVLTKTSRVDNLTSEDPSLSNIRSAGFDLYYDIGATQNGWLGGRTVPLNGGGSAIAYTPTA